MPLDVIWGIGGLAIGGGIVWWIFRRQSSDQQHTAHLIGMVQQMITARLDEVGHQLDHRLTENVRAMNESKSFLAERVSTAERTVRAVSTGLGKLEQATTALQRTSDEIAHFQNLLKNPKVRGNFGEVMLGHVLAAVLPQDRYELQFGFNGRSEVADAIIHLQDGYIVAIDAKFPLANYLVAVESATEEEQQAGRRAFLRDVKKHITDIAQKYISPRDKTLDYAFMYIPIEGIYYETMVYDPTGESLWEFCLHHKVIPVSPNSFLAYLQTILVGLRGLKVQQQAQEILRHLGQLRQDMQHFSQDYMTVGTHLSNAKNRYDHSTRQLDKLMNRLEHIEQAKPLPPPTTATTTNGPDPEQPNQ